MARQKLSLGRQTTHRFLTKTVYWSTGTLLFTEVRRTYLLRHGAATTCDVERERNRAVA